MDTQNYELGTYEGHVIKVDDGMINLTSMWKACGAEPRNKPVHWLKNADTRRLIETIEEKSRGKNSYLGDSSFVKIYRGGNQRGGTYAHGDLGIAYAMYLSPDFHLWCIRKIRETGLVEVSNGDLLVKLGEDGMAAESLGFSKEAQEVINQLAKDNKVMMEAFEALSLRTTEQIDGLSKCMTQTGKTIVGFGNIVSGLGEDVVETKKRMDSVVKQNGALQTKVSKASKDLKEASKAALRKEMEKTDREHFNDAVCRTVHTIPGLNWISVWEGIYNQFKEDYGWDIRDRVGNVGSKLKWVEENGLLDRLYLSYVKRFHPDKAMGMIRIAFI